MASHQYRNPTSFRPLDYTYNDIDLYSPRSRSTHYAENERIQIGQSRPRANSADARPQYHASRSNIRRQEYWNSFQNAERSQSQYNNPSMRYPSSNLPAPNLVYQREEGISIPQTNFSTSSEIVMIPGDPYNSTTRVVSPDKQQRYQHQRSASLPRRNNPRIIAQQQNANTQSEKPRKGWRGAMMKSAMVQKLKGKKSSTGSTGRKAWNIIPSLSRSRSLSPSCSSRSSRSDTSSQGKRHKRRKDKRGHFPHSRDAVYKDGAGYFPGSVTSSRSTSTISSKKQYYNDNSFDGGFDFEEEGPSHRQTQNGHDSSENFKIIRTSNQYSQAMQVQNDDRRNSNLHSRFMSVNNTISLVPRVDKPRSAPTFKNNMQVVPATKEIGSPPKVSPTSVMELQNTNNVRFSDTIAQASPSTNKLRRQRPKSILRTGRLNTSASSDDYQERAVRPSAENTVSQFHPFGSPSSLDFVDRNGQSLSPIRVGNSPTTSGSGKSRSLFSETDNQLKQASSSGFEKNIPPEYHRFFVEKQQATTRLDDSDMISAAYNEFIESVASVVVQTAARRFLAKLKVERRRAELAAARKYKYNKRRIDKGIVPTPRNSVHQSGRSWTSRRSLRQARTQEELFYLAAVRIQSIFRGWWARDSLKVDQYCATIIQKNFRSYLYRNYYLYDLYRIVVAQSVVRGYLLRKSLGYDSYYSSDLNYEVNTAATIIQSQWRSYSTEMKFLRTYGDILIIQSLIRGFLARRKFRPLLERNKRGRWGKSSHASRRRLVHLQQKTLPSSGFRSQTYYNPSTSYGSTWRAGVNTTAASGYKMSPQSQSNVDTRRKEQERKRQVMMEEEKRRKEREAAHAADMLAVQRRMEMKSQSKRVQNYFSESPDKSDSLSINHAGQVIHRRQDLTDRRKSTERVVVNPTNSYDSDKETEIQSNLRSSTNTISAVDGWRSRGQKSEAAASAESTAPVRRTFAKYTPRKSGNAFQDEMRSKRSNEEQLRINGMHKIWQKVGLMEGQGNGSSFDGADDVGNSGVEEGVRVPNFKVDDNLKRVVKFESPRNAQERKSFPLSQPKTERSLFGATTTRGSSYPFSGKSVQDNGRSKRLMQAFGLDDESDDDSTDSEEEEEKKDEEPEFMQRFSIQSSASHTTQPSGSSRNQAVNTVQPKVNVQNTTGRSREEQQRIDEMHEIFTRVGLMHRGVSTTLGSRGESPVQTTSSSKAYTSPKVHVDYSEPSAADLLKSWRNRDQKQPDIKGRLY